MKKDLESGLSTLIIIVPTILLAVNVSATSFDAPSPEADSVVDPGERISAFSFDVIYGGDENITNDTDPGTTVKEFIANETMFLNQSFPDYGVNGYSDGEDIVNVSLAYSDGVPSDLNATKIGVFGSDMYFLDGGVGNNSVFDGANMSASVSGEAVVKSSTGLLDNNSEVVVPGKVSARDLSPDMKYIESGGNSSLDAGFYGDEVLINSSDEFLNQSDSVYDLGGSYELDLFQEEITRYLESNASQTDFVSESAIIRETASNDNVIEEADHGIVKDGRADIVWLNDTNMLHGGETSGFQMGDPLYYSKEEPKEPVYGYVNVSDVRLGDYMVYSRSGTGVTLGQELFHVMNVSDSNPEVNDFGKTLDIHDDGRFILYEYNDSSSTTESWDPRDDGDQDVLFYAKNGTLGEGDLLVYDQRPENDNISVSPGEELSLQDYNDIKEPDSAQFVTEIDLGYNDSDGNVNYTAGDQVLLNVSNSIGDHVVLSPSDQFGEITSDNYNDTLGNITHWNTSTDDDIYSDGIYIAMNETTQVSNGDLRIGHWNKSVSSGDLENLGNGTVEASDLDAGAKLLQFQPIDNFASLDRDHDDEYDPGIGRISDNPNGREAIINTDDEFLNRSDIIVREGKMPSSLFSDNTRYFDSNGSGFYESSEAIVRYSGGFDNDSEVLIGGKANISELDPKVKYLQSGSTGFDPAFDPLFFDSGDDSNISLGVLDRSVSSDYVFTAREGNLQKFNRSLNSSGDNASVFLDSNNGDGSFNVGEEILELEILRNGSSSETVDGIDIINFANSTRHTEETYTGEETIVNDTDLNGVYQNVVESLSVSNIISDRDSESFFTEASRDHINEINLYRNNGTDYNLVAELTDSNEFEWNKSISEDITEDTEFRIGFKAAPKGDLNDMAYGFEGRSVLGMAGGSDSAIDSQRSYIVDAHAPELINAWTGNRDGGNSSKYNQVFIKTNEKYSNLDYNTVGAKDFRIEDNQYLVNDASETGTNDILLTLNGTLESNKTLDINLTEEIGEIRDVASNDRRTDNVSVKDGLKPLLEARSYHDIDENSTIDAIKLEFSENISYSTFQESDWNVTERQLDNLTVDNGTVNNNHTFVLEASAKDNITGVSQFEPFLDYDSTSIIDNSGNALKTFNESLKDRAAPRLRNASVKDQDNDARLDTVDLMFTEPLSDADSELVPSSFNVTDADILDVNSIAGDENLSLEIDSELLTSKTPNVTVFNDSIFDFDHNAMNLNQTYDGIKDKADPVLLHAQINAGKSNYDVNFVDLTFSEPVKGDNENVTLEENNVSFYDSSISLERTVNYTELLPTGNLPNITDLYSIRDTSGNSAKLIHSENVTVNSFRKEISEGWNFVSFPIADDSNPKINETLNTSKIDVIWTYRNKNWEIYDPEASENDFEEFKGGAGYMIRAKEGFTLNPNVNTVRSDTTGRNLIDASVYFNTSGYNLVGPFQEFTVTANNSANGAFGTIGDNLVGAMYEQKERGTRNLDEGDPLRSSDGDSPGAMIPGEAYWMNLKESSITYAEPEP